MSECKGRTIEPVHRIFIPNSVGFFYSAICQFIGYEKYGDEGKVMGLAPLGKDTYWDLFVDMIRSENGEIKLFVDKTALPTVIYTAGEQEPDLDMPDAYIGKDGRLIGGRKPR